MCVFGHAAVSFQDCTSDHNSQRADNHHHLHHHHQQQPHQRRQEHEENSQQRDAGATRTMTAATELWSPGRELERHHSQSTGTAYTGSLSESTGGGWTGLNLDGLGPYLGRVLLFCVVPVLLPTCQFDDSVE